MDRLPRTQHDRVLADVKAKPSGWPAASPDPGSGRGPRAASGSPQHTIQQIQVSTVSGDCRVKQVPEPLSPRNRNRVPNPSTRTRNQCVKHQPDSDTDQADDGCTIGCHHHPS
jgi:hypothetical protein